MLGLGLLSAFLYTQAPYHLGLDVKGGVRLTYEVSSNSTSTQSESMGTILQKTQTILENRVNSVSGTSEGTVAIKQPDQLVVEIPGYADIVKARDKIGTSASLTVYWAKNVRTDNPLGQYRQYTEAGGDEGANPVVYFSDTLDPNHTIIKPTLDDGTSNPAYAKMISGWEPLAKGDELVNASAMAVGNNVQPDITFTDDAGNRIQKWSIAHKGQGEKVAFVLDGKVLQIAPVNKDQLLGKDITVEGTFTPEYVKGLTALLNAGSLPVDLKLISSEKIDPTIGNSALQKMVFAGIIAFIVISAYLIIYYAFPGFVAFLSLLLYVLFTITFLKLIGATFSLAAIAGFVLSVGMAVDANILVFERFKEEMRNGKELHKALDLGFKRAFPAILDSNTCSILTAVVLASIGTGAVKGFAVTLIIGVLISLFTAVSVTRSLLFFFIDSGVAKNVKLFALNRNWFGEHLESQAHSEPLQIVNNWKRWFTITALVIAPGLVFIALGGIRPNVEFSGGLEVSYPRTANTPTAPTLLKNLEQNGIKGSNVKFATSVQNGKDTDLVYITVPGNQLTKVAENDRASTIAKDAGMDPTVQPLELSEVSPTVQKEVIQSAIFGLVGSFALIILWLGARFGFALGSFKNGLRFGASAIMAGLKDILVMFGLAAIVGFLKGWEISSLFLTAMLTIIGFSVHDKIVIFDRVRENLRHPKPDENFEHLINRSVTQSVARSINTAMAVVVTLGILFFFGSTTPDLQFFLLTMLVGIAWGTYSSIFTAAPVLYLWEQKIEKKQGEGATLLATAKAEAARSRIVRMGSVAASASAAAAREASKETPANQPATSGNRSYGQVKRRASAVQKSRQEIDEDDL